MRSLPAGFVLGAWGSARFAMDVTQAANPAEPRDVARPIRVGVVGSGQRAAALLRMLHGVEGATVAALFSEDAAGPAMLLADELGVFATCDEAVFAARQSFDVVIDAGDGHALIERASVGLPSHVEVAGVAACELLLDLLVANQQGDEQRRLFQELSEAFERNCNQERRMSASRSALELAHADLQTQLSEIYFTHEFFRALTRHTSLDDVCSVVVDGLLGVLGSEISAVYIAHHDDWTLRFRAGQGQSASSFAQSIPVAETILGQAFREGLSQEGDISPSTPSACWIDPSAGVRSHAATALRTGDRVVGVAVTASRTPREFSAAEMKRLSTLADQAALSLQNAMLLAELERLSVTDRLTQLYNHGYFHQRLEEEFSRSSRFDHKLALIILDLDDFKSFNDRYGHPRGDDALRVVSSVVRANLREIDVAARYGGEEFVVLLPETDCEGALSVAERIREGVESRTVFSGPDGGVKCTVSCGVAAFPDNAAASARLVEAADRALYNAKRDGKNRVQVAE